MRWAVVPMLLALAAAADSGGPGLAPSGVRLPLRPVESAPADPPVVTPEPAPPRTRTIRCLVTAYTDHDPADVAAGYGKGITATLTKTSENPYGVAADPRALPYGTWVSIPGYRKGDWQAVDDTGSRVRRNWQRKGIIHLDVRFKTTYSAREWGTRWVEVEVSE